MKNVNEFMSIYAEDLEKYDFSVPIPKLESVIKTIAIGIGKTLGKHKSVDQPFTFQVNSIDKKANLLTATISYRSTGKGNFGIGLKAQADAVDESLECEDFYPILEETLKSEYRLGVPTETFKIFVERFFSTLYTSIAAASEDGEVVLDFNNFLTCKGNEGKIALVAGAELKKHLKDDALLEESAPEQA